MKTDHTCKWNLSSSSKEVLVMIFSNIYKAMAPRHTYTEELIGHLSFSSSGSVSDSSGWSDADSPMYIPSVQLYFTLYLPKMFTNLFFMLHTGTSFIYWPMNCFLCKEGFLKFPRREYFQRQMGVWGPMWLKNVFSSLIVHGSACCYIDFKSATLNCFSVSFSTLHSMN